MRLKGFWGRLWGWSDIGATFDTEEEARIRVAFYEDPRYKQREKKGAVRYIYID
jgi:hypothetical protein